MTSAKLLAVLPYPFRPTGFIMPLNSPRTFRLSVTQRFTTHNYQATAKVPLSPIYVPPSTGTGRRLQ
jgi:hypothetical protein